MINDLGIKENPFLSSDAACIFPLTLKLEKKIAWDIIIATVVVVLTASIEHVGKDKGTQRLLKLKDQAKGQIIETFIHIKINFICNCVNDNIWEF